MRCLTCSEHKFHVLGVSFFCSGERNSTEWIAFRSQVHDLETHYAVRYLCVFLAPPAAWSGGVCSGRMVSRVVNVIIPLQCISNTDGQITSKMQRTVMKASSTDDWAQCCAGYVAWGCCRVWFGAVVPHPEMPFRGGGSPNPETDGRRGGKKYQKSMCQSRVTGSSAHRRARVQTPGRWFPHP